MSENDHRHDRPLRAQNLRAHVRAKHPDIEWTEYLREAHHWAHEKDDKEG